MRKGKVFLVGAGPGDVKLLTIKAKEVLSRCDTVVYDYLVNPEILKFVGSRAKLVSFSKNRRKNHLDQSKINDFLAKEALNGKIVVRLKGGDPFVFSRAPEELFALHKHNINFEVVPGITSGIAACEYAGIPITQRNEVSSVTFITGKEAKGKTSSAINWKLLAKSNSTLVFYMGVENLKTVRDKLIYNGLSRFTPCCLVQNATCQNQRVIQGCLSDIYYLACKNKVKPPAIFVVSKTVSQRNVFVWRDGFLKGKTIVVTREKVGELGRLLKQLGARIIHFPTIKIIPNKGCLVKPEDFDWIIFMGRTAVNLFKKQFKFVSKDTKIACIGPKTKELLGSLRIKTSLLPDVFSSEGLTQAFSKVNIINKNILIVRSDKGSKILPKYLKKRKANVRELAIYKIEAGSPDKNKFIEELNKGLDLITFLSAESVKNFALILKDKTKQILSRVSLASLGPETSKALAGFGVKPVIEPRSYTIKDLVEAIKKYY
jgi:uroporphyrinogen III methyltransferase/synthase